MSDRGPVFAAGGDGGAKGWRTVYRRLKRGFSSGAVTSCFNPAPETPTEDAANSLLYLQELESVHVSISATAELRAGEELAVLGTSSRLGSWQPAAALPLYWSGANVWRGSVDLLPGLHEFKCMVFRPDGGVAVEEGPNRVVHVPARPATLAPSSEAPVSPREGAVTVHVACTWCDTLSTHVTILPMAAEAAAALAGDQHAALTGGGGGEETPSPTSAASADTRLSAPPSTASGGDMSVDDQHGGHAAAAAPATPAALGAFGAAAMVGAHVPAGGDAAGHAALMKRVATVPQLGLEAAMAKAPASLASTPSTGSPTAASSSTAMSLAEVCPAPAEGGARRLVCGAHLIPHVAKVATGGEDAYFTTSAGGGALGVADGVSAWAEEGVDPGEYSRTLVAHCYDALEAGAALAPDGGPDVRAVIRYAQLRTYKPGSCTVVVAAMAPGGVLRVANLGDGGVRVVREGRVVLATEPQQHDFNLPYQISHPRLFPETDVAESADRYSLAVQPGDVVVAASDGLWDNMWDDQLLAVLASAGLGGGAAVAGASAPQAPPHDETTAAAATQAAAAALACRAFANAQDREFRSPWSVAAGRHAGLLARLFAKGGKMDDVTAVVGVVV